MRFFFYFLVLLIFNSCSENNSFSKLNFNVQSNTSPTDGGQILFSSTGPYEDGSKLTVTAVPSLNFIFSHWEGDLNSDLPSHSLIMNKDYNIKAIFVGLESFAEKNIVLYDANKIEPSAYFLMIENGQNTANLVNHQGYSLKEFQYDERFGNDLEILPNGNILGCFKVATPFFSFGGFGGYIKLFDQSGALIWDYQVNDEFEIAHHDASQLPNGNILIMVWERITKNELSDIGLFPSNDIFLEKLIEVNPQNNDIVWQWRSWDHVIQQIDEQKDKFGFIADNPNLININYNNFENGDLMHANGVFYDANNDLIYLSVNFYSEVWVIDHSTSIEQASSSLGGKFNRGGDLIYRYGNPTVFDNSSNDRFLFNNHHPSIIPDGFPGEGNVLVFNNGSNIKQSTAYELKLPLFTNTSMQQYIAPSVEWSFTNSELYFDKISGLQRLPNGNTLICEGDYGYWEVTSQGEIVWKYDGLGKSFWRGYYYSKSDPRLLGLNLVE